MTRKLFVMSLHYVLYSEVKQSAAGTGTKSVSQLLPESTSSVETADCSSVVSYITVMHSSGHPPPLPLLMQEAKQGNSCQPGTWR